MYSTSICSYSSVLLLYCSSVEKGRVTFCYRAKRIAASNYCELLEERSLATAGVEAIELFLVSDGVLAVAHEQASPHTHTYTLFKPCRMMQQEHFLKEIEAIRRRLLALEDNAAQKTTIGQTPDGSSTGQFRSIAVEEAAEKAEEVSVSYAIGQADDGSG